MVISSSTLMPMAMMSRQTFLRLILMAAVSDESRSFARFMKFFLLLWLFDIEPIRAIRRRGGFDTHSIP